MLLRLALFFTFALILAKSPFVFSEEEPINTKPLTAQMSALELEPGQTKEVEIHLDLAQPYKAYEDKFAVRIAHPEGLHLEGMQISPVSTFMDPVTKKEKMGLKGSGLLKTRLSLPHGFSAGEYQLTIDITYQACTDQHCLFPTHLEITAPLRVQSGSMSVGSDTAHFHFDSLFSFKGALEKGLLFTFLFVFLAGILTSFTPCIFPMIPITLSIIGASQIHHGPGSSTAQRKNSKWRGFTLSVSYVFGIALTYSILGVVAARTGALFGSLLGNPLVVVGIAILFLALALSMFGLYEIQMPGFIRNRLSATKTDPGYVGAFVTGLIAGVVASPCVGPVLVGILAHVAQTQDMVLGFGLLFTFASGMGLLLIAIGTFSSLSSKLPRSGPWLEFFKFFFGTVMVGMAIFYLRPISPSWLIELLAGLACVLISSFFGAFKPAGSLKSLTAQVRKGSMVALFALGLLLMGRAVMTYQSPTQLASSDQDHVHGWNRWKEEEFEAALAAGRPIIIDFWAEWCAACLELEKYTFSNPEVKSELNDISLFRVDMTVDNSSNSGLKERFRIQGLPTLLFYREGKLIPGLTLTGFESAEDFNKRIRKLKGGNAANP